MASLSPRVSNLWADPSSRSDFIMGHPDEDGLDSESDDLEQQRLIPDSGLNDEHDCRTPLDKTIDRIGMGAYQWMLLSLCGFGWMADNMWMQAIAIILPRVQQHYQIPDNHIGIVSSSMFAGMMFGAVGWGTYSDLLGRSAAFNATLFFTSVFGLLASLANSFLSLCILLFLLGSAVGGSMPTDGTLLLEHMPKGKQYLVTALSVFFSIGSVLASFVALIVLPQHSCPPYASHCNVNTENQGWKYLLITLALITLSMFLARIVFFRLHESPRYLVHAGRPQEALVSLQMISRFNGSDLTINLDDVHDHEPPPVPVPMSSDDHTIIPNLSALPGEESYHGDGRHNNGVRFPKDPSGNVVSRENSPRRSTGGGQLGGTNQNEIKDYHAIRDSPPILDSSSLPGMQSENPAPLTLDDSEEAILGISAAHDNRVPNSRIRGRSPSPVPADSRLSGQVPCPTAPSHHSHHGKSPSPPPPPSLPRPQRRASHMPGRPRSRRSSVVSEKYAEGMAVLPKWIRRPLLAWLDRVAMVLSPQWLRTTLLVWSAWCAMSLAYTMFNVYLPKLLETQSGQRKVLEEKKSLEETLWDILIYTIGGCPGAIFGAYLVESRLGKRWSLAGSSFITAALCVLFVAARSPIALRLSTVGISLSSTTMWAVLYGWTPEIFGTKVRGTACGMASALSRIGGMVAPLIGGALLIIDRSVPVYFSVVIFGIAGICVLLLKEERTTKGDRAFVH